MTSESAKNLAEEQRKCRFKSESGSLRLFTGYTQSACLFECQLEYSYSKCQCIPWNYPHFESGIPICHRFSQDCFEIAMGDTIQVLLVTVLLIAIQPGMQIKYVIVHSIADS